MMFARLQTLHRAPPQPEVASQVLFAVNDLFTQRNDNAIGFIEVMESPCALYVLLYFTPIDAYAATL